MTNAITTVNLCKRYGETMRVKDLALEVPEQAVYGFLGPNGAGKSTTMKMMLGLVRPTHGTVSIFEREVSRRNRLSLLRSVGALIEAPSYYAHLTGQENLRILTTLRNLPDQEIDRVLSIVRLQDARHQKVGQYSLGMKQRLGLAAALLGTPRLLMLDEPTNGLDPAGMQEVREFIRSLPQQYGMTVMVSSHLLGEIDQIADSVGIISHGELVFQGNLSALHAKSHSGIAIRTLSNEAAQAALAQQGIQSGRHDGFLLLPALSDAELARHIGLLCARGIGVTRIEERRKTLEDIFLELTGTEVSL